ncbi:TPA: thioredoxin domain-containing protein [Klebsiella aerogenes]|nr:thioredoxin domain-containing protein [Klebsiella aerogenes]
MSYPSLLNRSSALLARASALTLCATLATLQSSTAQAAPPTPAPFTPAQTQAVGEIAAQYLLTHPEVLAQASDKLRQLKQQARLQALVRQAVRHQEALLHAPDTPVIHEQEPVSLVVFADYQCIYCARSAPMLERFMANHPDVRVVFREWPIFAARWPTSLSAARTGLAVWHQNGGQAYLRYHNALFATGHNEGRLTQADIDDVLKAQGLVHAGADRTETDGALQATSQLAQTLGLTGTPAFFIMPTHHATVETTTALPGLPQPAVLEAALVTARQGHTPAGG